MPQVDLLSPMQQGQQFFENEQRQKFRRQQEFLQLDQQRQAATFQDARTINSLLKSGQIDKALQVTGERKGFINQLSGGAGDTRDTDEIEQGILSGDIAGTINLLDSVDKAGVQGGFLTDPRLIEAKIASASGISSEGRTFDKMLDDAGLSPLERKHALRVKLRLAPGAVGSSAQTISQDEQLTKDVATSQAAITSAKETGKLSAEFKLKPKIAKAVALSTAQANLIADDNKLAKSNGKALNVYDTAFKSLTNAFEDAYTGPVAGLMPALTSSAQTANAAVSMVAPTLKKVFREAGEGTFTDADQKLLTNMLPTRQDQPETVKWKLNAIDSIVRAKLGAETTNDGTGQDQGTGNEFSGFKVVR